MQTTPQQRIDDLTRRGWWGEQTLLDMFDAAVASAPEHPALVDQFNRSDFTDGEAQRLTFRKLADAVERVGAALYAGGIRREDIVVVQLPNIAELPIMYLALARLGAIISPVPVQYGPFELGKARELLEPAAFVSLCNFKGRNYAQDHGSVFADACRLFAFGDEIPAGFTRLSLTAEPANSGEYADYVGKLDISANDILTICWTSGTTGQPKGVPRSHNMWMASGRGAHDVADMRDGEAILNPFPMVNMAAIGGFLFPWLMRASTLVLHHPLDLPVFLKQIEKEKISYTIAPPAVLNMLLKQRELLDSVDISSLRAIGSGSAPLSEWMVAEYQQEFGIAILNVFGSNEGICLASDQHDVPDPADRARFFPRFGVEDFQWRNRAGAETVTRLVDLQIGEIVTAPGAQGEMEIKGATVFDGYWKSPEANAEVFTEDGFFRTGDVFEIVGDGERSRFYKFVGRCKDIIVRGGVNISPDEIDNLLAGHPKVAEVAVVGYADEIMGERIGAAVVAKPGESVTLDELTDFLRGKGLAVFKLPEQLRLVDAIPHNAVGKVLRRDLVNLFDDAGT
jgi:acyl-CoA synthetase (AMP-forming)/AMP-acid ligase II